ncbi:MAG: hypothetical protein ACE5JU_09615, partial [Candidatus Binatia bacterium]
MNLALIRPIRFLIKSFSITMTTLYSLTDWQYHAEHDRPVLWDDLVDVEGHVHITISTRTWVEQELQEEDLSQDDHPLYESWLRDLHYAMESGNVPYPHGFIAHLAEDGIWDLLAPQDELTPQIIAD